MNRAAGISERSLCERRQSVSGFFPFHDNRDEAWPYNHTYDGWWGHDTLPKLAYEDSPELEQYIMDIGRKWVSPPYNVDGWRLDVGC